MNDDDFAALRRIEVPEPSAAARQRAFAASMTAFEAAKTSDVKKSAPATQGSGWGARLKSIVSQMKGQWIMDTRIPLGTAVVALLLLPLGYQLYSTTAMTRPDLKQVVVPPVTPPQQQVEVAAPKEAAKTDDGVSKPAPVTPQQAQAKDVSGAVAQQPVVAPEPRPELALGREAAPVDALADQVAGNAATAAAPSADLRMQAPAGGIMMESDSFAAPAPMPSMTVAPTATMPSGDEFAHFEESPLKVVATDPVSTFSIDVDTASYSYVRRMLEDGYVPEPDAVRLEEMINYFPYNYAGPDSAGAPFKASMGVIPTPWNPKTQLLEIGIKGYVPPVSEDKASNLVFLIDTSGSMDEPDKLPLLKRAFALLVDQLSGNDTVSIVVYAGSAGVVLEPTKATDKTKILAALDNLSAGGSTAGAEGIDLAYQLAEQHKVDGGINRVILATDGDFNVGIDDPADLTTFIKSKRDEGISLSVLGFGRGNLDDATMQALAQNGNGNASYISSFKEAQKVLVAEGGSTLQTIAQDVKLQVEFNPAVVSEYRLVGYETRALNREDFNNDAVDAGDIGAGHTVTAIYEITPVGAGLVDPLRYGSKPVTDPGAAVATTDAGSQEIAFLKMRYKLPNEKVSQLIEQPVTPSVVYADAAKASDDMRFAAAVAAFGQKLKGSNYGDMSWEAIKALAQGARGTDESGYRAEFVQLIDTAKLLKP
ncbi:VWA domain-containing protein [Devosia sp.]|uniref:vWA domain-containing protein n=1 Tax=Devosia sp. TaxID=1871048 RepID=UPI00326366A3